MSQDIQRNELHYYIDLLRMQKSENRRFEYLEFCRNGLYNTINTMKIARDNHICGEDLSCLNFGNIPLNGIKWSHESGLSSNFEKSRLRITNVRSGHSRICIGKEVSPDGKLLLTGSEDGKAIVWDLETGLIKHELMLHSFGVIEVSFSKSGQKCLTVSRDSTAAVWSVETGKLIKHLKGGHKGDLEYGFFSPDESKCVTCSVDGTAIVWNIISDTQNDIEFQTESLGCNLTGTGFSSDGNYFFTVTPKGNCTVWDRRAKASRCILGKIPNGFPETLYINQSDDIAMLCDDESLTVFSSETGKPLYELKNVCCFGQMRYSTDLYYVFTYDSKILLVDKENGAIIKEIPVDFDFNVFEKPLSEIAYAEVSPDMRFLVVSFIDRVIVWEIETQELLLDVPAFCSIPYISPEGNSLYIIDTNICIQRWNLLNKQLIFKRETLLHAITQTSISSNGNYAITISNDGLAYLWNLQKQKKICTLSNDAHNISAFSTDNQYFVICTKSNIIKIWKVKNDTISTYAELTMNKQPSCVQFTPDGRFCLLFSDKLYYWSIRKKKIVIQKSLPKNKVDSCTFVSDKKNLFVHTIALVNFQSERFGWKYFQHLFRSFVFYSSGQYQIYEDESHIRRSYLIPHYKTPDLTETKSYEYVYRREYLNWILQNSNPLNFLIYEELCAILDIEYDYACDIYVSFQTVGNSSKIGMHLSNGSRILSVAYTKKANKILLALDNGMVYVWDISINEITARLYHTDLLIQGCNFKEVTADDLTKQILYQYGAKI